jgi:hypothetical protein
LCLHFTLAVLNYKDSRIQIITFAKVSFARGRKGRKRLKAKGELGVPTEEPGLCGEALSSAMHWSPFTRLLQEV